MPPDISKGKAALAEVLARREAYSPTTFILNTLADNLGVQPELTKVFINDAFLRAVFGHDSNKV